MKIADFNSKMLESWWAVLRHLNAEMRLELASRLIESLKTPEPEEQKDKNECKKLYGAWANEKESAEELIKMIRNSRSANRQIESFD